MSTVPINPIPGPDEDPDLAKPDVTTPGRDDPMTVPAPEPEPDSDPNEQLPHFPD
ncbi:hypothetical protein [Kribbella deserti]|uniref:Stereocilin n=1 Tax=Kribbella deserti TaxID=1926257 RepID=A0ABV6QS95_9ACTN